MTLHFCTRSRSALGILPGNFVLLTAAFLCFAPLSAQSQRLTFAGASPSVNFGNVKHQ